MPKDKISIFWEFIFSLLSMRSEFIGALIGDIDKRVQSFIVFSVSLKRIVFLISLVVLLVPVAKSLRREPFYTKYLKNKVMYFKSILLFIVLSILYFPIKLSVYGYNYANMSYAPFDMNSGWLYRRLLMPALAHFLGFQGLLLYYLFSLILIFVMIYLIVCYFEYYNVKLQFVDLISLMTSSVVIFNFMSQGFPDVLMFILFLIAFFVSDSYPARLSVLALGMVAHEASAFFLVPIILFIYPKEYIFKYLSVIGLYVILFWFSLGINIEESVHTYVVIEGKTSIDWVLDYPLRLIGGWIAAYKVLWIIIVYGIWEMLKAAKYREGLFVIFVVIISPLMINLFTYDVSRHVGWGSMALLMCISYLLKNGYGEKKFYRFAIFLNILIPSIYVGTNAGFRSSCGLYRMLYEYSGLQNILNNF